MPTEAFHIYIRLHPAVKLAAANLGQARAMVGMQTSYSMLIGMS